MGIAHSTAKSFWFAFEGIKTAFTREPNFKIHTALGAAALILGAILKFSRVEWLILLFTITLVLILELINTALEAIVDLVSPEIKEEAKVAKDVSAAAVLIASIAATVVGLVLFLPKILLQIGYF